MSTKRSKVLVVGTLEQERKERYKDIIEFHVSHFLACGFQKPHIPFPLAETDVCLLRLDQVLRQTPYNEAIPLIQEIVERAGPFDGKPAFRSALSCRKP